MRSNPMATRILQDIRRQVAVGKARGNAEGKAEILGHLVKSGAISIAVARTHVKRSLRARGLSRTFVRETLQSLG